MLRGDVREPRLADPRFAAHQDEAAAAGVCLGDASNDLPELAFAADENTDGGS